MNKIFKTIFDKKTSRLIVTSELAKNSGGLKSESNITSSLDKGNSKSSSVILKITGILGLCIASIPMAYSTPAGTGKSNGPGIIGITNNQDGSIVIERGLIVGKVGKLVPESAGETKIEGGNYLPSTDPGCGFCGQIVTGSNNAITTGGLADESVNNGIIGGNENKIDNSHAIPGSAPVRNNFIGGGYRNVIDKAPQNSAIVGGKNNKISGTYSSDINNNCREEGSACGTSNDLILGGENNSISASLPDNIIIGGNGNHITDYAIWSAVISSFNSISKGGVILGVNGGTASNAGVAIGGISTMATGSGSLALIGGNASGQNAIAAGSSSVASGINATALNSGKALGSGSFALNWGNATGSNSVAIGPNTSAQGTNAVALGNSATSAADNSYAFGNGATADKADSYGIGGHAKVEGSVALGKDSVASTAKGQAGYDPSKSMADNYKPQTTPIAVKSILVAANAVQPTAKEAIWKSTASAVSVGNIDNGITRQITSLAAGTQATDAVNVAQLQSLKTWTQDGLDKANEKIKVNSENIEQNKNNIALNKTAIEQNKQAINANKLLIGKVDAKVSGIVSKVAAQHHQLNEVKADISKNAENIVKNSKAIDTNKASIADNKGKIAANTAGIAKNKEAINDNKVLIGKTDARVSGVVKKVADNTNRIDHVVADTATNTKNIAKMHTDVSSVVSKVATNTAAINQVVGRVSSNTKAIEANTNAIEANKSRINHLDKREQRHMAQLTALAMLFPPYSVGKLNVTAAVGQYRSNNALAVGFGYRTDNNFAIKAGLSMNTKTADDASYGLAVNYEF